MDNLNKKSIPDRNNRNYQHKRLKLLDWQLVWVHQWDDQNVGFSKIVDERIYH